MLALLSSDITASPGRCSAQQRHQQVVGGQVAGVLELLALEALAADLGQQVAGDGGRPGGEGVVVVAVGTGRRAGRARRGASVTGARLASGSAVEDALGALQALGEQRLDGVGGPVDLERQHLALGRGVVREHEVGRRPGGPAGRPMPTRTR